MVNGAGSSEAGSSLSQSTAPVGLGMGMGLGVQLGLGFISGRRRIRRLFGVPEPTSLGTNGANPYAAATLRRRSSQLGQFGSKRRERPAAVIAHHGRPNDESAAQEHARQEGQKGRTGESL
ncbi:Hypothetical predicted protein [Drosophila guanche]|uniref:Uncharacterized protein n=1 Tax=Drosophila guanche TaxID=7266 RepID=A0A3B0J8H9_DROGU|nr:Hypothetical predicted protein [Drosophila guanche]